MDTVATQQDGPQAQVFAYHPPGDDLGPRHKNINILARTDTAVCAIQVIDRGGENRLHSHKHLDGVWIVLRGRVRFYTTSDEVVAELGALEGILIPRGYKYWFESASEERLEILQFEASARTFSDLRETGELIELHDK